MSTPTLSYANVPLLIPDADTKAELEEELEHGFVEATARLWPGKNLDHLGFQGYLPDTTPDIGTLVWPNGASRFGYIHCLCSQLQLTFIRQACYQGTTIIHRAQPLILGDGTRQLSTSLYLLPPRPLWRPKSPTLYLLTLVDHRFYWWFKAADITVTAGDVWLGLYSLIAAALGITINVDPISSVYLKPPPILTTHYRALPLLLDSVAADVGQRIVRGLDGTVRAMNTDVATGIINSEVSKTRPLRQGGLFAFDTRVP